MNTQTRMSPAVHWPTPPFFRLAESPPPAQAGNVLWSLLADAVTNGELVEFEPGMDSIGLRLAEPHGLKRIDLASIRSIKLTRPVAYVAEAVALDAIDATKLRVDHEKPFVVSLRDGTKMTGKTLGFVKEEAGLFLFLVEGNSAHVVNCFIPAGQIKDVQIGLLLGDALVEKHVVSAETLALALNKQAKLRQERIGKYLTDRAIISAEELTRALREQGKRANVPLGEILIEAELITPEQLKKALAIQATTPAASHRRHPD